jgi:hypothetical protein
LLRRDIIRPSPAKDTFIMKIKSFTVSALLIGSAVSLSACSTLKGAGIGAAGGAGVAAATGGSVEKGAAIGGTGGAVVGTVAD